MVSSIARPHVPLLAVLGCLFLDACGTTSAGSAGSSSGVPDDPVLYDTTVAAAPAADGSALARAVERVVAQTQPRPKHDPRLSQVAARLLEGDELRTPEVRVIDGLMREQGLVEPVPQLGAAMGAQPEDVARMLASDTARALSASHATHYGFASRRQTGGTAGIVLLASRHLQLEPVPQSVAVGSALSLRGRVLGPHRDPRWVVTPPRGDVQRLPGSSGTRFAAEVPLSQPGQYRVELLADGPTGVTVLANFPVWAGEHPPTVRVGDASSSRTDRSAREVEQKLRALIAAERKRHGRPPLRPSAALSAVAQAHSEDMAAHGFIGHESPRTGGPADRVRAAGLTAWLVRENLGRGYSAEEIHEGLMQSPGHRDNLLSADAEQLGLGVVMLPETPKPAFLATQLFASLSGPVDVQRARREVLAQIARRREEKGLKPVQTSSALMRSAQQAAAQVLDTRLNQQELLQRTLRQTRGPKGTRVGGTITVVPSLSRARDAPLDLPPEARLVGVGVSQGEHPQAGAHALAIVMLYGLP